MIAVGRRGRRLIRSEAAKATEDLIAWGAPAEAIAKARADEAHADLQDGFLVHADNETAVRLFLAVQTQWRVASLSTMARAQLVNTGLDYVAVERTAVLEGLELKLPDDFRRLRIMEAEALSAWSERRAMQK
ncbi:MAG TPA: DUF1799 domain-containing protein [Caulobacteraceae bacterium]|nr:DUF1799 domain-containing protein [Caulobacteraceae bacterium]